MIIQVNTDNHIHKGAELIGRVETDVENAIGRFSDQITRVEVHLHDQNGHKGGSDDKKCLMEARPAGHQPIAVSCAAGNLDDAIAGAATKLEHSLQNLFDKLGDHKGRTSFGGDQVI